MAKKVDEEKPLKRWKIVFETDGRKSPYMIRFRPKWRNTLDKTKHPEIWGAYSPKSFRTKTAAIEKAKAIMAAIDQFGSSVTLDSARQANIIRHANELETLGFSPEDILSVAVDTARKGLCASQAIKHGRTIIESSDDYTEYRFKDFIDEFEKHPNAKANRTHKQTIRDLRNQLVGLGDLQFKILHNPRKAIEELRPIFKAYIERDKVAKLSALNTQFSRLRQLLTFMRNKALFPTEDLINLLGHPDVYDLDTTSLESPAENYAFRSSEVLLLIKFFSQIDTLEPFYPIICGIMGQRRELYQEFKYEFLDFEDKSVLLPREYLKPHRQGAIQNSVNFMMSEIPNLYDWLKYARDLQAKHGKPRLNSFVHLHNREKIGAWANECLREYGRHFFCKKDANDNLKWGDIAKNGFRSSFISFGDNHTFVKPNVSAIAADKANHDSYVDPSIKDISKESRTFFSMNPTYLELVDLEKNTIDMGFLYADIERKKQMLNETPNKETREIYERIIKSHDPEFQDYSVENLFSDDPTPEGYN